MARKRGKNLKESEYKNIKVLLDHKVTAKVVYQALEAAGVGRSKSVICAIKNTKDFDAYRARRDAEYAKRRKLCSRPDDEVGYNIEDLGEDLRGVLDSLEWCQEKISAVLEQSGLQAK